MGKNNIFSTDFLMFNMGETGVNIFQNHGKHFLDGVLSDPKHFLRIRCISDMFLEFSSKGHKILIMVNILFSLYFKGKGSKIKLIIFAEFSTKGVPSPPPFAENNYLFSKNLLLA